MTTKVKILSVSMMDVKNGTVKPLEDQINEFLHDVVAVQFSYSAFAGYQSVLIAYAKKPKKTKVDDDQIIP